MRVAQRCSLALPWLLLAIGSCGGDPTTALYVRILSDRRVPEEVDLLHFQATTDVRVGLLGA